jgi:sugar lactone lactonase YvrE
VTALHPARRTLFGLILALLAVASLASAAQPQFWKIEGAKEFLEGDTEGLSVDSEGRVRLAPATKPLHDPEAPTVWALARDRDGRIFAATGNEGRVFRIDGAGTASVAYDAAELEAHALAVDGEGRVYAGSSPDGAVYRLDKSGRGEKFFDPDEKYVWALAVDRQGRLLVATGAEGRVHRVPVEGPSAGKGELVLSGLDGHITSLAVDPAGNVYAGSSPSGIVYRIDPAGKVFVLHDAPFREVKALAVGEDGGVYAAVIDGRERDDSRAPVPALPAPLVPTPAPSAPAGEVTVTESFSVAGVALPPAMPAARAEPGRGATRGAVLRILPGGEIETLWSSTDEMPHALAVEEGGVLAGTGNKGKLYRIRNDRTWAMLASFPAEQVTSLLRGAAGAVHVATSNPGRIHVLESQPASAGTFVSPVKDTETVSTWGRVRWEGVTPPGTKIEVQTRSGNTGVPDATWTAWSAPVAGPEGAPIGSEKARFLQLKVLLTGAGGPTPILDTLTAAYLQRNLRPQIQAVTVHPPGEIFQRPLSISGDTDILGYEGPMPADIRSTASAAPATPTGGSRSSAAAAPSFGRKMYQRGLQTFSWKADDPNGDSLSYEVHYRRVGDTRYRLLRKASEEAVIAWDTSTVPNGRYVVRVTASDSPSNPESLALAGDRESAPFDVDNTPPDVTVTAAGGGRVQAVVRDASSQVRRAEFSVDGGRWQEIHPGDGINDALEERYEIPLPALAGPSPHIVVVRASDALGNVSTGRIELP